MLSFGLHNRRVLGKIVGKFSEHKTVTSVLVRCEIAGNSKSFSDEAHKNGTSCHHGVLCNTKLLKLL